MAIPFCSSREAPRVTDCDNWFKLWVEIYTHLLRSMQRDVEDCSDE